jgi:hypothetical protein
MNVNVLGRRALAVIVWLIVCSAARIDSQMRCDATWSVPQPLLSSDGRHAYVEGADAIRGARGEILLLGRPAWFWATPTAFEPDAESARVDTVAYARWASDNAASFAIRLDRKGLANPGPDAPFPAQRMIKPRGAVGRNNVIHVVWASPPEGSTDPSEASILWYSKSLGQGRWTEPRKLFEASSVSWWLSGEIHVTGDDVHILSPYFRSGAGKTAGGGVAYVRSRNGRWKSTTIPVAGFPSYVSGLITKDSLLVVVTAADTRIRARNGSHLHSARASVGDTTWSLQRIQWSGLGNAWWPRLFRVPDEKPSAIIVTWGNVGSSGAADSVLALVSRDGGTRWTPHMALALDAPVGDIVAHMDAAGRIHTIGRIRAPGREASFLHVMSTQTGTRQRALEFGPVASAASLSVLGDSLLLMWGAPKRSSTAASAPVAPIGMLAVLSADCGKPVSIRR